MKALLISSFLLLASFLQGAVVSDDYYIETAIDDFSYTVTYVRKEKITPASAKHAALVYAAKIGNKKKFNYFTLDSTEDVVVSLSKTDVHPGIKLFITYYYDRPSVGEIYEICNLVFCR